MRQERQGTKGSRQSKSEKDVGDGEKHLKFFLDTHSLKLISLFHLLPKGTKSLMCALNSDKQEEQYSRVSV